MDINRGVADHAQAVSILREYRRRRQATGAFAEWFSIDPPFPDGIYGDEHLVAGAYCNGGIMPLVGGELARAAFEHGFESYGVEILEQYHRLISAEGETYLLVLPRRAEEHRRDQHEPRRPADGRLGIERDAVGAGRGPGRRRGRGLRVRPGDAVATLAGGGRLRRGGLHRLCGVGPRRRLRVPAHERPHRARGRHAARRRRVPRPAPARSCGARRAAGHARRPVPDVLDRVERLRRLPRAPGRAAPASRSSFGDGGHDDRTTHVPGWHRRSGRHPSRASATPPPRRPRIRGAICGRSFSSRPTSPTSIPVASAPRRARSATGSSWAWTTRTSPRAPHTTKATGRVSAAGAPRCSARPARPARSPS